MREKFADLFDVYEKYLARSVKRRNRPYDPASSPKHHGDRWVAWEGTCGAASSNHASLVTVAVPLMFL
jgi:hypothetical protein